ncbi:hypothetical protein A3J56_00665 [Candidatus Giovannonibacteria bacterium RIFCSPHIGHO2_02_FULL_46_20]|uniref:Plasmid stabilization protein n=1 Tax=Candidatus Giovannonibacteria bacterium RIFCSPHIGHO2_02_FULL_46_20 TaxID=1798338 RepID=A0A1F5WD79_9BACT|nr:MAG: hypothetical protein A3J56_00665 [Candidatus Giovannonibacteria bacterium RIFCSPHIGHO2_02_FULL_46_20]
MRIFFDNKFIKDFKKLPRETHEDTDRLLALVKEDPFHSLLHTKKLGGPLAGLYSFRVKEYRVLFRIEKPDTVFLIEIGNRKDIYKK